MPNNLRATSSPLCVQRYIGIIKNVVMIHVAHIFVKHNEDVLGCPIPQYTIIIWSISFLIFINIMNNDAFVFHHHACQLFVHESRNYSPIIPFKIRP